MKLVSILIVSTIYTLGQIKVIVSEIMRTNCNIKIPTTADQYSFTPTL